MSPAAEPPSRRVKRVPRTFMATTVELDTIASVLNAARTAIADQIEADQRKAEGRRLPAAVIQEMQDRAAMLARVIVEMRG